MRLGAKRSTDEEAEPHEGQQWEYKAVQIRKGFSGDSDKLNEHGQQGWELVCIDTSMRAWFKRPKTPTPLATPLETT